MDRTQIFRNGKLTADFKAKPKTETKNETKKAKKAKDENKEQ